MKTCETCGAKFEPGEIKTNLCENCRKRLGASNNDFYHDGEWVVFTSSYHLRKQKCCENNCRHCPYR